MPGAGKSTIGALLAKLTSRQFIDTDVLIQISEDCSLQNIVDNYGYMAFRNIEEKVIFGLDCHSHVIATGGSAVYSQTAMRHLKSNGIIIFLDVDLQILKARVHDFDTRGLSKRPAQNLVDLFKERFTLYKKYADITVKCSNLSQELVCTEIINKLPPLFDNSSE
jgi:shikimate kinase